jgi:2,4-dienoyl-CoA reductase-like NADH-dependent reductase (Old Yellow Enzyme family)
LEIDVSLLFDSIDIKEMKLKNRFVRSATHDGAAQMDGRVSGLQTKMFGDLAAGGCGLILTGIAYVQETGQLRPPQMSLHDDSMIPGLSELAEAVQTNGGKLAAQLFHAGRERSRFQSEMGPAPAPSLIPGDEYYNFEHRAMDEDEIWEMIAAYGDAARRCQKAGLDAVQVHSAHAYLLAQWMSPYTNRRDDQWGGSLDNRLRLVSEIYKDIRSKVGQDYPILIKIGIADAFDGGMQAAEGIEAAVKMAALGFDALEISQGLRGEMFKGAEFRPGIDSIDKEAYFRDWTAEVKERVKVPVMMVGGLRTFSLMEEVVAGGEADFISLSRPLIREPDLINGWRQDPDRQPKCISCNGCLLRLRDGKPLACALDAQDGE